MGYNRNKYINHFAKSFENMRIFEKTEKLIDKDPSLIESVKNSIEGSFLFDTIYWSNRIERRFEKTEVEVTTEGSFNAAYRIRKDNPDKKIAVLNFASAKRPGGMVTRGSSAQEECLCRVSTLYNVLSSSKFKSHYVKGKKSDNFYIDELIYSPDIKVVLHLENYTELKPEDYWSVDVITSAFPNLRNISNSEIMEKEDKIKFLYDQRIENVFQAAMKESVDILILGAWGCGVFRNDPAMVAESFLNIQYKYEGIFEKIIYPVYCKPEETHNYEIFRSVLA